MKSTLFVDAPKLKGRKNIGCAKFRCAKFRCAKSKDAKVKGAQILTLLALKVGGIYMAPPEKNCGINQNLTGPSARAFKTFNII